ncbi:N-acetylmuramoyl-L-alanine amidase [Mycobacterium paragordonae]|uniref:N-acetylmuramoyl-L-alanine amidase n=1 Tax=Mycobacterium paragordonae TaxID=1389713 RepID=UPI0035309E15
MPDWCGCSATAAVSRRNVLKYVAAAPIVLGLGTVAPGLAQPPRAAADPILVAAVEAPGQAPNIVGRAQWGAQESLRSRPPVYDNGIKAGVVHHTATVNEYAPQDSAAIVRSIYAYHTRNLGWPDIAYNALVDKYGQVFEGRFGGMTRPVQGTHTGGFNRNTWAVCMIGEFDAMAPTPIQVRTVGRLLGWRLAMDGIDPRGSTSLTSDGGPYTRVPRDTAISLPNIFAHRDVSDTDCPGKIGYVSMSQIRDVAAQFTARPSASDLAQSLEGTAIYDRWRAMGGMNSTLGAPKSPESQGAGSTRYVIFDKGAMYWSPASGAQPVTGSLYAAWGALGYEHSALGLPTSAEIQEPEWIAQNFQHGTLNLDRHSRTVTSVIDGIAALVAPPSAEGPPTQLERFSPARNRV